MRNRISKHNSKVLNRENSESKDNKYNCRIKENCPIPGECLQKNVVYQAEVHADDKIMTYYGSTVDFKSR